MRLLGVVCCVLAVLVSRTSVAADRTLAVIVHPSRTDRPSREDVERMYLRQRRFWEDGSPIVPLNRESGDAARDLFSRVVLGKDGRLLEAYWNEQYFHGIFPPTVLSSTEAMRRYVASDRNAIGYLWTDDVTDAVRVVLTLPASRQP